MNILSTVQIRSADHYTIEHEPISSILLMERAASACAEVLLVMFPNHNTFSIFCGTGNNGGDGLVMARILAARGKKVIVYLVNFSDVRSKDNEANLQKIHTIAGVDILPINSINNFPLSDQSSIILDALLGTGASRPLTGLLKEAVEFINSQKSTRIAIDLPTGVDGDGRGNTLSETILEADYTLTFQAPKLCFFLPSYGQFVGKWTVIDIGLDQDYIQSLPTDYRMVDRKAVHSMLRSRASFTHKGNFGHGLVVAGSHGKIGASILASKACLKSGAGLVTAFIPKCGYTIMQSAVPEVMVEVSNSDFHLSGKIPGGNFNAFGIGPGLGDSEQITELLQQAFQFTNLVLDADALNCLGRNRHLLSGLPEESILTPHLKEFERMFGESSNSYERLQLQREMAMKLKIYILLKGKNSSIACPDGKVYFNSTGNPGMATAGSGDVLTGIITGLLCQGYSPFESVIIGAYLHGLSGDLCLPETGEEALVASDIIDKLGKAFLATH